MRFLIINGPNLNLLGRREPEIYGAATYDDLCRRVTTWAESHGHSATFFQSNHEGAIIDAIQESDGKYDGIVINPGAFAHYSYAIHDALRAVSTPAAEVHISDIHARERWRNLSVTAPACRGMICGMGIEGYCKAMEMLV